MRSPARDWLDGHVGPVAALSLSLAFSACSRGAPAPAVVAPTPAARTARRLPSAWVAPPPTARAPDQQPVVAPTADPAARRLLLAQLTQPAVPLSPPATRPKVTASALDDTARGEAAGMTASGPLLGATLVEGQRASAQVSIAPGACATFVAHGGLGAIEIDAFLTTREDAAAEVLAEDPLTGPIAVLGGGGRCLPGSAATTTAILSVVMRRGSGPVLVQGYRR